MKTITISDEDYAFLMELKKEMLTQDNRSTADVCFQVRDKKVIYGMDEDYCDSYEWRKDFETYYQPDDLEGLYEGVIAHFDEDETKCDKEKFMSDDYFREDALIEAGFEKVFYCEIDEIIQTFFTEKYADIFMHNQKHHLSDKAFIYGDSFYRNYEQRTLRNIIMKLEENNQ